MRTSSRIEWTRNLSLCISDLIPVSCMAHFSKYALAVWGQFRGILALPPWVYFSYTKVNQSLHIRRFLFAFQGSISYRSSSSLWEQSVLSIASRSLRRPLPIPMLKAPLFKILIQDFRSLTHQNGLKPWQWASVWSRANESNLRPTSARIKHSTSNLADEILAPKILLFSERSWHTYLFKGHRVTRSWQDGNIDIFYLYEWPYGAIHRGMASIWGIEEVLLILPLESPHLEPFLLFEDCSLISEGIVVKNPILEASLAQVLHGVLFSEYFCLFFITIFPISHHRRCSSTLDIFSITAGLTAKLSLSSSLSAPIRVITLWVLRWDAIPTPIQANSLFRINLLECLLLSPSLISNSQTNSSNFKVRGLTTSEH